MSATKKGTKFDKIMPIWDSESKAYMVIFQKCEGFLSCNLAKYFRKASQFAQNHFYNGQHCLLRF